MQQTPLQTLKEIRSHGTMSFPCAAYRTCSTAKGTMVKYHWHDEIEIIYFTEGDFRLEINMEHFYIRSECLYFINPGELHSIITEKCNSPEEYAVVFAPDILGLDSYNIQMQFIQPVKKGEMLFPRCLLPEHPAFSQIRDSFMEIMLSFDQFPIQNKLLLLDTTADELTRQLFVKSSLLRIFAVLSAHRLLIPTEKNYNKRVEEIKTILMYIKDNYKEKIYIRDLAVLIGMNEQYFCRFFKKAIGRSPIEYLNEYRIKQSTHLLEQTDLPVMEVCLECGYNNLGNFLREFKKYTGTTPLKYRRKILSSSSDD